ncbi:hypothetical protein BY996DRAFT_6557571, partial [Phakopsora pachyrhizi]
MGSIPAPPINGWCLESLLQETKQVWLQSLENDLKLFQKLMPSASGGAVINAMDESLDVKQIGISRILLDDLDSEGDEGESMKELVLWVFTQTRTIKQEPQAVLSSQQGERDWIDTPAGHPVLKKTKKIFSECDYWMRHQRRMERNQRALSSSVSSDPKRSAYPVKTYWSTDSFYSGWPQ